MTARGDHRKGETRLASVTTGKKTEEVAIMGKLSNWFGLGKKSAAGTKTKHTSRKSSGNKRRASSRASGTGNSQKHPYRAVAVHTTGSGCAAAKRIRDQRFLAAAAPQLPLGGCNHPQQCACRYKYFTDRRQEPRRDADHGLPSGPFAGSEQRYRRDRRRQVPRGSRATA